MKNFKRVLAFALAFVMVLGLALPAAKADGPNWKSFDVYEMFTDNPDMNKRDFRNVSAKDVPALADAEGKIDLSSWFAIDGYTIRNPEDLKVNYDAHDGRIINVYYDPVSGADKPAGKTTEPVNFAIWQILTDAEINNRSLVANKEMTTEEAAKLADADGKIDLSPYFAVEGYKIKNPEALKVNYKTYDGSFINVYYDPISGTGEPADGKKDETTSEPALSAKNTVDTVIDPGETHNFNWLDPRSVYPKSGLDNKDYGRDREHLPLHLVNSSGVRVKFEVHNAKGQIVGEPIWIEPYSTVAFGDFKIGTKLTVITTNPDEDFFKNVKPIDITIAKTVKRVLYDDEGLVIAYKYVNPNVVAFAYEQLSLLEDKAQNGTKNDMDLKAKPEEKKQEVKAGTPTKVVKSSAKSPNPKTGDPAMIGYVVATVAAAGAAFATKKKHR